MTNRIDPAIHARLLDGQVIPACPLALGRRRGLDERHQRALLRYYAAAGAGGIAIGVHTTQFRIRDRRIGLFKPLLELAAEELSAAEQRDHSRLIRIGGICGRTPQAVREAETIREQGFHAGLLSLAALSGHPETALILHCRRVAAVLPMVGFYLQPAVGGIALTYRFWRRFLEIPNVVAIKVAPFNRYQTLEVLRAVADSGRTDVALYTGNDDNIVADLLTVFRAGGDGQPREFRMVGGLLGQWALWTRQAVSLLRDCHRAQDDRRDSTGELLTLGTQLTDANAAIFDATHSFAGCIPGIHEMLRRQRLLAGRWCLDPEENLSPGQLREIDRVWQAYPHLRDDLFVEEHLDDWLRG